MIHSSKGGSFVAACLAKASSVFSHSGSSGSLSITGSATILNFRGDLCVAQRLEKAEPVTPPGIPASFPTPGTLISEDCIRQLALA
jgi:hypothetical protein